MDKYDVKKEGAKHILNVLRTAQNCLASAAKWSELYNGVFNSEDLEKASTLIGNTMDSISEDYKLPVISRQ